MKLSVPLLEEASPHQPALYDDLSNEWLSYGKLADDARAWADRLPPARDLVFIYARNDIESVTAMLGALAAGHAVALLNPELAEKVRLQLESTFSPGWIVGPQLGASRGAGSQGPLHPDLGLLLSTSGSTGSAKLVRLKLSSIRKNAENIAEVLSITKSDVASAYLPLHYSYGLSVLTSHLIRGAALRLTSLGPTDREFWRGMRDSQVTHMPGVPFHIQTILKLGLNRLNVPALKTLTQAGGGLDEVLRAQAHALMSERGGRFFVLYGQTEAAPRMTTLQHEDFLSAPKSVGTPLPGCRIEISDPDGDGRGEVIFHGPNVMMGYAQNRNDLGRGDELLGRLATGDLGFLDEHGQLTLVGRSKRISKLFGLRINLDEIEAIVNTLGHAAVTQKKDILTIHLVSSGDKAQDEELKKEVLVRIRERFTGPPSALQVSIVSNLPKTIRGKVDYQSLEERS